MDHDVEEPPKGEATEQEDEAALDDAVITENQGATAPETTDAIDIAASPINNFPVTSPNGNTGAEGATDTATQEQTTGATEHHDTAGMSDQHDADADADDEGNEEELDSDSSIKTGYNLRTNCGRSYGHRFASTMDNPMSSQSYEHTNNTRYTMAQFRGAQQPTAEERILHSWVMTQMSAKAGIRRFGEAATKDAMRKEFRQLDEKQGRFRAHPRFHHHRECEETSAVMHKRD